MIEDMVSRDIDKIRKRISDYRIEKEEELLLEASASKERVIVSSATKQAQLQTNQPFTRLASKEEISRFLEVDCIISPYTPLVGGEWPAALIRSSIDKSCDLGFADSHGSLWKMIRKDIGIPGTHVILQSSEIGERALYVTSTLALSADITSAALWTLRVQQQSTSRDGPFVESNEKLLKPTTAFGSLIQFVLLSRRSDGSIDTSSFDTGQPGKHRFLVAAKATSGSGEKGVAVLNQSDRMASNDTFSWAMTWQIVREDATVDGFSFLDSVELNYSL
jgi:hypothetical protein